MIDLLEPRRLFTTVASAEAAVTADVGTLRSDLTAVTAAAKTDVTAVNADLKALAKTAADKSLIKSAAAAEAAVTKVITNGIKKIYSVESAKLKQLISDGLAAYEHPNSKAAKAKLTTALSTAVADVKAPLTALGASAATGSAKVAADLADIAIANPTDTQLPTDVFNDGSVVTTDLTKLETDAQTAEADLTALVSVL